MAFCLAGKSRDCSGSDRGPHGSGVVPDGGRGSEAIRRPGAGASRDTHGVRKTARRGRSDRALTEVNAGRQQDARNVNVVPRFGSSVARWRSGPPREGEAMRILFRFLCLAACGLATSLAGAGSLIAVEYYHGGYGHYFVTASPQEIAALDAGTNSRLEPHRGVVRRVRTRHRGRGQCLPLLERADLRAEELALLHADRRGVRDRQGQSRLAVRGRGVRDERCPTPPAPARGGRCRSTACTTMARPAPRTTAIRPSLTIRSQMVAQGWIAGGRPGSA